MPRDNNNTVAGGDEPMRDIPPSPSWRDSLVVVAVGSEADPSSKAFQDKIALKGEARSRGMHSLPELPDDRSEALSKMDNYYVSISDPRDGSVRARDMGSSRTAYDVVHSFYAQIVFALLFIISFIMVFVQCCGGRGRTSWFTFFVMLSYTIELGIVFAYEGKHRLARGGYWWRRLEPLVLLFALVFEGFAWGIMGTDDRSYFIFIAWLRLFCWIAHGKTRFEQLQIGVRALCSADRRRYRAEGFDLDLAYVHRNIAAMAWPADNFERVFRNPLEEVVSFLDCKHPQSYLVVNLCSERTYAPALFRHQTAWYPMDDHNPAELEMILAFCREAVDFTAEDPYSRLVIVHCKGGKGRTGTLICAYLLYVGLKRNAESALSHFAHLRTRPGASSFQGVQAPSQYRYVCYFEKLLKLPNLVIPRRPIRFSRFVLHNVPWLWCTNGIGKLWFVIETKPCTERTVVFKSNEDVTFSSQVPDPSTYTAKQLRDLFGSDEDNLYKECNEMDAGASQGSGGVEHHNPHAYKLDTTSFWYYVNRDYSRKLGYEEFQTYLADQQLRASTMPVDLEFKDPDELPQVEGDVVFKFYFARNNPNPLEPPVQFWIHTSFELANEIRLSRSQLDGPHKDKKYSRYPLDFSISLDIQEADMVPPEDPIRE